ncbi:hypothetical protein JCM11641_000581 [Rhodosporidiobolus odoratus]
MFTRTALRPLTSSTRARSLHSSTRLSTTHPAKNSLGNSVGEDATDVQRKNAAIPVFMAAGAAILGYIGYSQYASGKQTREEASHAKTNQAKSNPPAGSKENTGTRG